MATKASLDEGVLRVARTFNAPRAEVFRAWTDPKALKKWWAAGPGMSTPFAEVDLRVGGKYRLAMQAPNEKAPYIVGGIFTEVKPPEKVVCTWRWEGKDAEGDAESVVTVVFKERGKSTEVVLTHGPFVSKAESGEHTKGWEGCFDSLARFLGAR